MYWSKMYIGGSDAVVGIIELPSESSKYACHTKMISTFEGAIRPINPFLCDVRACRVMGLRRADIGDLMSNMDGLSFMLAFLRRHNDVVSGPFVYTPVVYNSIE